MKRALATAASRIDWFGWLLLALSVVLTEGSMVVSEVDADEKPTDGGRGHNAGRGAAVPPGDTADPGGGESQPVLE